MSGLGFILGGGSWRGLRYNSPINANVEFVAAHGYTTHSVYELRCASLHGRNLGNCRLLFYRIWSGTQWGACWAAYRVPCGGPFERMADTHVGCFFACWWRLFVQNISQPHMQRRLSIFTHYHGSLSTDFLFARRTSLTLPTTLGPIWSRLFCR